MIFKDYKTWIARYWPVVSQLYWRDFKIKYKRTAFGYLWSFLNPLLHLVVTALFFNHLVGRSLENYTQFLFSGILPWGFIEGVLMFSMSSYLENESFIKRVRLPLLIFPLVKLLTRQFDFILTFIAMALVGSLFSFKFTAAVLLFPLAIMLLSVFIFGLSLILAPLVVYFRDMEYLMNVILRILYFATPIVYSVELAPQSLHKYFVVNPFFHFIQLFQNIFYFGKFPTLLDWMICTGLSVFSLVFGYWFNKKTEQDMVFFL